MKPLTRIRIILFALMIFGAFANFALNEWGLSIITIAELFMALSFLGDNAQVMYQRIKNSERKRWSQVQLILLISFALFNLIMALPMASNNEILGITLLIVWGGIFIMMITEALYDLIKRKANLNCYENFFLAMFCYALYFKNMAWPGAGLILVFSVLLLLPYYLTTTVQFFKANYKSGISLVTILAIGCMATILLGITNLAKTMHWPSSFVSVFFYFGMGLTLLMLLGLIKWKYDFNGERISIVKGLRLFKTKIVLIYFMMFIVISYKYLVAKKIAPDFYSQSLPSVIYKLRELPNFDSHEKIAEYESIIDAYRAFIDHSEQNGFVK